MNIKNGVLMMCSKVQIWRIRRDKFPPPSVKDRLRNDEEKKFDLKYR